MKKISALLPMFCLCLSTTQAADWLSPFDFSLKKTNAYYKANSLELPEPEEYDEPSVEDYNAAVTLNNQAIEAMNSNNNKKAVELMEQAVATAPGSKGFRKNYLIALNKAKQNEKLIKQANIQLSLEPEDHKTAYLIGLTYLNDLKQNELAADYFTYALNLSPDDTNYALALITALENTNKYSDSVFELLKKYASKTKEAYPYYLLGLKYLDKENYSKALEEFAIAKKYDLKGYSHHAYIRAAFYSGNLNGLESITQATIRRFPDDKNIKSTSRIYNSLKDSQFNLKEHIVLKLTGASSLEELNFNIRPVRSFQEHQIVNILSTELISKGKRQNVTPKTASDGSLIINVPKSMWSTEVVLEINYHIELKASYNVYYDEGDSPDIDKLKEDAKLNLDDSRLDELASFVDSLILEDSDQYESYPEIFVAKASTAVAKGLNYTENGIDNSVSWALDNSNLCDCTEYSRLLTALCLKRGISARLVTGFLIKSELINQETSIGHEWCEVYIKGKGWTPVDATLQSTTHRAYNKNLLNDQIFFEYPYEHEKTRIGIDYTAKKSDVSVSIENNYKVYNFKN